MNRPNRPKMFSTGEALRYIENCNNMDAIKKVTKVLEALDMGMTITLKLEKSDLDVVLCVDENGLDRLGIIMQKYDSKKPTEKGEDVYMPLNISFDGFVHHVDKAYSEEDIVALCADMALTKINRKERVIKP